MTDVGRSAFLAFLPMSNPKKLYVCTTRIEVVRVDKEPDTAHITGVRRDVNTFIEEINRYVARGAGAYNGFTMEWYVDKADCYVITGLDEASIHAGMNEAWYVSLATLTPKGVVWNKKHPLYETNILPTIK